MGAKNRSDLYASKKHSAPFFELYKVGLTAQKYPPTPKVNAHYNGNPLVDQIFFHENEISKWAVVEKNKDGRPNGEKLNDCLVKFKIVLGLNKLKCEAVDIQVLEKARRYKVESF